MAFDPISAGIGAVGMGISMYEGFQTAAKTQQIYNTQKDITGLEGDVNMQRQQQMMLSANRQQMETFRNVQRARAQGLNAAVNQGANKGSGLQGGQAQATDQGLFNNLGVSQNLQIGQNIFSLDNQISGKKMQISDIQGSMATDQAWANVGSALTKNAGTISNIYGAGSSMAGNFASLMSPGSLSGGQV